MFCAPILHSSCIDSLIRPNDTIDGMPLKQLRTGILQRCLSSGLATSYVALIYCTLQHPYRHPFPSRLPRGCLICFSAQYAISLPVSPIVPSNSDVVALSAERP